MAEEQRGQDKTEQATPRHLEKAREQGQVARSRELSTSLVLLAGGLGLLALGSLLSQRLQSVMRQNFDFSRYALADPSEMLAQLSLSFSALSGVVGTLLLLIMFAGVLGSVALGGWLVTAKPIQPRASRLNPVAGLQRMFSLRSLVELLKALAKILLIAGVAVTILWQMEGDLLSLGRQALRPALSHAAWIVGWSLVGMSAATLVIAAIDVPFQLFDHKKKLRMTRQQVKDELKDSEGRPEVKSRVRQLQRQLAQSRMMDAIAEADVVLTNPEHFSVALKYDVDATAAPKVLAKGADHIALKIRQVAVANDVPLLPSPLLARAIYFSTEIDEEIPQQLYLAVAQVLAYIYQLRGDGRVERRSGNSPPPSDALLDIPAEFLFDSDGQSSDS